MQLEYQDGDVGILSRDPLRGSVELVGDEDDIHELILDRDQAEELLGALTAFLLEGEGGDMPKLSIGRPK